MGLVVGVFAGMFGVGGGALIIIGLLAIGFGQHAAHATSLAAIVATSAAAVVPFVVAGAIAPLAAVVLAVTAFVGVNLTASLLPRIPEDRLRQGFAVFLLLVAARMAFVAEPVPGDATPDLDLALGLGLMVLGVVTGALSALLGVGGGLVMVPALVLLFGFGQHAAEGTSLAVVIPTALMGAARHARSGLTDWAAGGVVGVAGIAGGLGAGTWVQTVEGPLLQRLFAVFLAAMAVWLLRRRRRATAD